MRGKPTYKREHQLWQELCTVLKDMGAVTEQDLNSRVSEQKTPGQRLLRLIRSWGDVRVVLHQEQERP